MIGASVAALFGYAIEWTRRPAVDGLLMILSFGLVGVVGARLVRSTGRGREAAPHTAFEAVVDACLIWIAYYAAYRLRFGNGEELRLQFPAFLRSFPLVVTIHSSALLLAGIYTRASRGSMRDRMVALASSVAASQVLLQFLILVFWAQTRPYSRGVLLVSGIATFGLLAGWRVAAACVAVAPSWWRRTPARRFGVALATICAVTGAAWGIVVPPFEAPDEIYFLRTAVQVAEAGKAPPFDPMFFRAMRPVLHVGFDAGLTFDAVRNPAFRFVSNEAGRVTMFRHGPGFGSRTRELAALYLFRGIVLGLAVATTMLIYVASLAFFRRPEMALLVAGLCFLVPQFSFMAAKVNPESLSMLWGAAVAVLVAGRATGRVGAGVAWSVLIPLLVTAPLTDSAALFLVPFAPIAMAIAERGWKRRLTILGGLVACVVVLLGVGRPLAGALPPGVPPQVRDLLAEMHFGVVSNLGNPLAPFLRAPDTAKYLVFEFTPKMFFGFLGWLGQPSILLPAWFYAALFGVAVGSLIGLGALCGRRIRSSGDGAHDREPGSFLVVAAVGVVAMLIPIVYSTALFNRNEWYGRWLFSWLGPIMILIVVGVREFGRVASRRPHLISGMLAILFAIAGIAWLDGIGTRITSGIRANHYGDQDHLLETIRYAIASLGLLAVLVELAAFLRSRQFSRLAEPRVALGSAWAVNLVLLFGFVRPLYEPLDAPGYANAIRGEIARREFTRAAEMADTALREFPESTDLIPVVPEMMAWAAQYDALAAHLRTKMAARAAPLSFEETLALARALRTSTGKAREDLLSVARSVAPPALDEDHQMLARAQPVPDSDEAVPDDAPGPGKPLGFESRGVRLESVSTRLLPDGNRIVIVYFRPKVDWAGRRLWVHAYPAGSHDYVDVEALFPPFAGWHTGELAWEAFRTPGPGRFNVYIGIALHDLGDAYPVGTI